jgi:hypothetical protein
MKKSIIIAVVVYMVQWTIMSFGNETITDVTGVSSHISSHLEQVK